MKEATQYQSENGYKQFSEPILSLISALSLSYIKLGEQFFEIAKLLNLMKEKVNRDLISRFDPSLKYSMLMSIATNKLQDSAQLNKLISEMLKSNSSQTKN